MRAFSLYFEDVPVIVLNGADWVRGRLFSLIHEYAHLLLHTSGLATPRPTRVRSRKTAAWRRGATPSPPTSLCPGSRP